MMNMAKRTELHASSIPEGEVSDASSSSSTGTIVPTDAQLAKPPSREGPGGPTAPSWRDFFEQQLHFQSPAPRTVAENHAYLTPPRNIAKDPLFVCHHGAGASGLSFAVLARQIRALLPGAGVLSVEARYHGSSVTPSPGPDEALDMSLETLSTEFTRAIQMTAASQGWEALPNTVLVGHSLGGAVVANVAKNHNEIFKGKLVGYMVIDVVEGSAMEALKSMQSYLSTRPETFPDMDSAVAWHVRSRTVRNPESAAISTPPLLLWDAPRDQYIWRTDLSVTKRYWENWFTGLSGNFLGGRAAKILLLAGTDRLDKELMIGQMQGKFQLQVFPDAGHFVQEDLPERTAEVLVEFYKRNDRSELVLPPKVGDLLKQGKKV